MEVDISKMYDGKYLTAYGRTISNQRKKDRTKIANLVARKPEIKKRCCICGSTEAKILHNDKNPYCISFICDECREVPENVEKAKLERIDIRRKLNCEALSAKSFSDIDVKVLVDEYLSKLISIGAYCEEKHISRHVFNKLIERYEKIYNDVGVHKRVTNHSNKINRDKLSKIAYIRNGFNKE